MTYNKVVIIGSGNVAYHLAKSMVGADLEVRLYARNKELGAEICTAFDLAQIHQLTEICSDELVVLCVNDMAVQKVILDLPPHVAIVYTSGNLSLSSLKQREHLGVFYPLQTFTKGTDLAQGNFPILIESNNLDFQNSLLLLAKKISTQTHVANSEQRRQFHISAVFANNFVNHLWHLSKNRLDQSQLDWNILLPLINESVNKLQKLGPFKAQTGPARRIDNKTIEEQLNLLSQKEHDIYRLLTDSILDTYGKEEKNEL